VKAAAKTKPKVRFEPTSGGGVTERGSWVFTAEENLEMVFTSLFILFVYK
jgi:hypothetical protein